MPKARTNPWKGQGAFLTCLEVIETGDDAYEVAYRGWSTCRICGKRNGSTEYVFDGWKWPSGFRHYVEAHNLRPSLAFIEFITGKEVT